MSMPMDPITAKDVSLGEFVTLLVLQLDKNEIPMPFQNEEKWHRLFYGLKMERGQPGRPSFLDRMRFDWDGRYPKSQDLSEHLQVLHWNGFVSVANPSYDRLRVDQDLKDSADVIRPNVKDEQLEQFLSHTLNKASELFR